MNENINLSELIRIISTQSQLDTERVAIFVTSLFREIEKGLVTSSYVQIGGIGIFRVIKSSDSYRILYLANFDQQRTLLLANKSEESTKEEIAEKRIDEAQEKPIEQVRKLSGDISFVEIEKKTAIKLEQTAIESKESNRLESDELGSDTLAFSEEDGEAQQEFLNTIDNQLEKKRRFSLKIISAITVGILLLSVLGYLYFNLLEYRKEVVPMAGYYEIKTNYTEVANTDTATYSHIIIPDTEVEIMTIAKKYYGNEYFWPYVYMANQDYVEKALTVIAGTVVKIPRIDPSLLDINNPENIVQARKLGEQILAQRASK